MENENTETDLPNYSIQEVISTNNTIDNALLLLGNVNFNVIEFLLEKTPENLKTDLSYKILVEVKNFNEKITNLFNQSNKS